MSRGGNELCVVVTNQARVRCFAMGTRQQHLCVIERTARGFSQSNLDAVKFVPMLSG